ncbi:14106_t:CDS:2 [Dentiscutata heterogama]|uniref:14106_t:CDS:1 n=1 Tax=Dentiscutata heterogama TaxID=1316150 RepID=A0ACA9LMH9_9GLOM|nr:14106_t:CDS:2 [Dentiscutata heterogama]
MNKQKIRNTTKGRSDNIVSEESVETVAGSGSQEAHINNEQHATVYEPTITNTTRMEHSTHGNNQSKTHIARTN